MNPEQIKALLNKEKEEYNQGNWAYIYAYMSDDYVFHYPPNPDLVGIEANREYDQGVFSAFSDIQFTGHQIIVEGDFAAWTWTWQGVHTGVSPSHRIPPTGKTITMYGCDVYRWQGDKIVEQWRYTDLLSVMQQMGVIPSTA